MINQIIEITKDEYDNRIKVYELYLKIKEEINGKKIIIEKNEYEELIFRTEISTILNYIKESIPILINKKIEESQIKSFKEKGKKNNINEINIYENHLRKLENQLRYYIKQILIYKIQKDSFEKTLRYYMEMEIEFEELKEKLKYDEGEFLNNDRKENEIEILRRENSNLKKVISTLEKEKKNNEILITNLNNEIEKLNKIIIDSNDLNSISIAIKKNCQDKSLKSLNLIIKQNINHSFRNKKNKSSKHNNSMSYDMKSHKNFKDNKKKNINENDIFTHSYNKIFGDFSVKKKNKKSKNNLKNNSINNIEENKKVDIIKKYFSNGVNYNNKIGYKSNYNYLKYNKIISNAASSSKFCLRKEKSNYSLFSINVNNSKKMSKSGNGSLSNLKSFSKEYEK